MGERAERGQLHRLQRLLRPMLRGVGVRNMPRFPLCVSAGTGGLTVQPLTHFLSLFYLYISISLCHYYAFMAACLKTALKNQFEKIEDLYLPLLGAAPGCPD